MPHPPFLAFRPGVGEPVVLMISRREVEAADLNSVLSRLKAFLATREDAWRYRGQMTLVVGGYNNDPRELVDTRPDAGHFASAWLLRQAARIQRTGRSAVHRLLGWQQAA